MFLYWMYYHCLSDSFVFYCIWAALVMFCVFISKWYKEREMQSSVVILKNAGIKMQFRRTETGIYERGSFLQHGMMFAAVHVWITIKYRSGQWGDQKFYQEGFLLATIQGNQDISPWNRNLKYIISWLLFLRKQQVIGQR